MAPARREATHNGRALSALKAVGQRSVVDLVKAQMLDLIRDVGYQPGDRLPSENEFSDKLQVSRGTVREALRAIATHGIIERSAGLGYFVRGVDPDSLFNTVVVPSLLADETLEFLQEVRAILEVHAISLAVDRATPRDLTALDDNLSAMATEPVFGTLALICHELIVASAHNPVLDSLYRVVVRVIERSLIDLYAARRTRTQEVESHRILVDAIKSRDQVVARRAMSTHLKEVSEILGEALSLRRTPEDECSPKP